MTQKIKFIRYCNKYDEWKEFSNVSNNKDVIMEY
jgi:hypothetical protein